MASNLRTLCLLIMVWCLVPPVFCYNSSKIPLYIGGMMSMTVGWDGSGCLVSAELALEQINNRSDILPDYELKMVWNDSQCIQSRAARILFRHIYSEPQKILLLSPPCSPGAQLIASASRYWNLINNRETDTSLFTYFGDDILIFWSSDHSDNNSSYYSFYQKRIHDIIASLGFTMVVSTLVARIWLVYNSLKSDDHAGSSVLKIGGIVAVLLTFDVICLVLKIFLYPVYLNFVPLGIEVDPEDSNHFIEYYFSECSSGDGVIPLLLSFADKAVMLLTGSFLSYEITQANLTPVGDSKQVAICIYNIILFGVCGLILTILLKNTPTESYIFASSLVICCTTVTILVLYLPKIIYWVKNRKMDENHKSRNSQCTSSPTDVSSGTASTNKNLRGKVPKELLDENIKLKDEYEQLQQMALQRTRETTAGGSNKMLTGY
ncbi:putative gamma-aminobutyric acid type B receptor subunit 1 [Apostichopus japonicus]|uniref:Putative gamma-aminobutyric acid type B receptor subunit 1 n=1 Tax=Stichopus japonicus TaxID=307972 RepID=A0A2G8KL23_STIJA|nr:putative gamma-aminobutyric acid type B receptor subunit 1 [Apostichopus japonicus]